MSTTATVGVSATFSDTATGLAVTATGSAILNLTSGLAIQDITLAASTSLLSLTFPANVTTAKIVFVKAVSATDLTVQVSTAVGSTVITVPQGAAIALYSATAVYVNSPIGGTIQFGVGS